MSAYDFYFFFFFFFFSDLFITFAIFMTRKIFLSVTNVMQTGLLLLSMPAQADELESLNTLCERLAESVVSLEQAAGGSVGRDEAKARGKENMSIVLHHISA